MFDLAEFSQIATPQKSSTPAGTCFAFLLLHSYPLWPSLFTRTETRFVNRVDSLSPPSVITTGFYSETRCVKMGYSWAMAMGFFWRIWESVTCGIGDIQLFLFPRWDGGCGGCGGGKNASSFQLSQRKSQLESRKASAEKTTHFLPAADICLSWWEVSCVFFPLKARHWNTSCSG